jgi:hypothetical protein
MNIEQLDPALEVNREGVQIVVDGFRGFTLLANQIMISEGVGTDDGEGNLVLPKGAWLNLRSYLKALRRVEQEFGGQVLRDGGQTVPKHVNLPPQITDIYSALGSLDIAYHMNHRKSGELLFNPATGKMQEGIGHYQFQGKPGDTKVSITSDVPYPCAYDHGIVIGMSQRFIKNAQVVHGPTCRSKGAQSCTYTVTWK